MATVDVQMEDSKPAAVDADNPPSTAKRESLDGSWILDKSRENWSMKRYLETLHVNDLAIEAHEKGELEHDTIHTISIPADRASIQITKRSRVNNDLIVALQIGVELVEHLKPDDRPKKSLATTEDNLQTHVQIESSLLTMNGMVAHVVDVKRLKQEDDTGRTILVQELTIKNEQTQVSTTTTRYFLPYENTDMQVDDPNP